MPPSQARCSQEWGYPIHQIKAHPLTFQFQQISIMFQTLHETYTKSCLFEIQIELGIVFIWPNYVKGSAERDTTQIAGFKLASRPWGPHMYVAHSSKFINLEISCQYFKGFWLPLKMGSPFHAAPLSHNGERRECHRVKTDSSHVRLKGSVGKFVSGWFVAWVW